MLLNRVSFSTKFLIWAPIVTEPSVQRNKIETTSCLAVSRKGEAL
jgi:hypothetical protein